MPFIGCRVRLVVALAAVLPLMSHAAPDCFADPTQTECADDTVVAYDATAVQNLLDVSRVRAL